MPEVPARTLPRGPLSGYTLTPVVTSVGALNMPNGQDLNSFTRDKLLELLFLAIVHRDGALSLSAVSARGPSGVTLTFHTNGGDFTVTGNFQDDNIAALKDYLARELKLRANV